MLASWFRHSRDGARPPCNAKNCAAMLASQSSRLLRTSIVADSHLLA
jgi:hypothetical protein